MSSKEFTVVIPAYNEMGRIDKYLPELVRTLDKYLGDSCEVIIVTDGCTDGTDLWVHEFSKQHTNIKHLNFKHRLGKGRAIVTGLSIGRGRYLAYVDADGSVPPKEVVKLLLYIKKVNCDLVIASRYLPTSQILRKPPLIRILYSRIFNAITKMLFPVLSTIHDTQCGLKVIRRSTFSKIKSKLLVQNFAFDVNLILSVIDVSGEVVEVPIQWFHVDIGSKVNGEGSIFTRVRCLNKVGLQMLLSVLKLKLYRGRLGIGRALLQHLGKVLDFLISLTLRGE
ncbi:MAG: hypothetical protein DRJ40_03190 [Thermoprotei archaeon]|nr:MAG: hypothetical protein DRJ40_03190 [Thermoprotei archaeon]